jgi:hypothetical protein
VNFTRYSWSGGEEFVMSLGEHHTRQITFIMPLFEEANRFRKILADIIRALNEKGIGSRVPDLPGTGESLMGTDQITCAHWQSALNAFASDTHYVASFRGGCLFDSALHPKHTWRFAPESGQRLVRDLRRTQLTQAHNDGADGYEKVAGNIVKTSFLDNLMRMAPVQPLSLRTIQLESHAAQADAKIPGQAVWRRSEPCDDPVLRAAIVDDLTHWIDQCAA